MYEAVEQKKPLKVAAVQYSMWRKENHHRMLGGYKTG
jgi:hypothetical protein